MKTYKQKTAVAVKQLRVKTLCMNVIKKNAFSAVLQPLQLLQLP